VSCGSRDLFPAGWCACNQIPLVGPPPPTTLLTEEAGSTSCSVNQQLIDSCSSSCSVEETAATLERPLGDVPVPKAGLTGEEGF